MMRPMLDSIRFHLRAQLQRQKDVMGYNRAALTYLQRDWKARNTSDFLDDNTDSKPSDDEKKRKFVQLASQIIFITHNICQNKPCIHTLSQTTTTTTTHT